MKRLKDYLRRDELPPLPLSVDRSKQARWMAGWWIAADCDYARIEKDASNSPFTDVRPNGRDDVRNGFGD
jgi:hypothetical protein